MECLFGLCDVLLKVDGLGMVKRGIETLTPWAGRGRFNLMCCVYFGLRQDVILLFRQTDSGRSVHKLNIALMMLSVGAVNKSKWPPWQEFADCRLPARTVVDRFLMRVTFRR